MSLEANNPAPAVTSAQAAHALPGERRIRYSEATAGTGGAFAGGGGGIAWNRVQLALGAGVVCLYFLYATAIMELKHRWISDAGWSHGWVVPAIAAFFIKLKWDTLRLLVPRGTWVGLVILLIGILGQVSFRVTGLSHMSAVSILVVLFGAVLFIFGWEFLKILWLPIAYLGFAVPPPSNLYVAMTTPMQTVAAELGVQLLPFFGVDANRAGTIIHLNWNGHYQQLFVADACSGMRMLVAFFALAVALAYSTSRPVWEKLTLAACALPIAIFCNGLRVALTGVMVVKVNKDWGHGSAHEYFGMVMLIPAMLMQLGVAWVLDRVFVSVPDDHSKGEKS